MKQLQHVSFNHNSQGNNIAINEKKTVRSGKNFRILIMRTRVNQQPPWHKSILILFYFKKTTNLYEYKKNVSIISAFITIVIIVGCMKDANKEFAIALDVANQKIAREKSPIGELQAKIKNDKNSKKEESFYLLINNLSILP